MPVVKLTVITQSELGAFRTCRKRWWFGYEERLRPLARPRALEVGSAVHAGIGILYSTLRDHGIQKPLGDISIDAVRDAAVARTSARIEAYVDALWERFPDVGDDERELITLETQTARREALTAIAMYVEAFAEHDAREFMVEAVEQTFDVPLGSGRTRARLLGAIDLVLRHKRTSMLWLNEHKSTKQDAHLMDARLDVDGQVRAYTWAMRHLFPGESVGGVMLNCIRKSAPKVPKVNKDGRVSVAACDTTSAIYARALREQVEQRNVPVTDEQRAFRDSLPADTSRWVSRHEHFIKPREVDEWVAEAVSETKLIRAAQSGKLVITRNPASCVQAWQPPCPFRSVCVDDSSARRSAEYRVGDRHEEIAEDKPQEHGGRE